MGSTLHGIGLYLSGFHYRVTREQGTNPDHGSSGLFEKMAHFIGLVTNVTPREVANTFLREIWKLDGLPSEIMSDIDAKCSGEFWELWCKALRIKRGMSTAYHPRRDGQTERTNQGLEGYLRNFVNYDQDERYHPLPLAKYAYNNSKASVHKLTPLSPTTGSISRLNGCKRGGSKPRVHNVYALNEESAGEGEDTS